MPNRTQFKLQVEWRSPDSIKPYARNHKKHTDSSTQKLADHIKKFGWDVPIVVDERGEIIKGHRRYRAAKLLKLTQVPVIVRGDLSPEEVKAERLADNRLDDDSLDDQVAIALELQELEDLGFDLNLTGFDPAEIDKFLEAEQVEIELPQVFGGQNQSGGIREPREEGEGRSDDEDETEGQGDEPEDDKPKYTVPQGKRPLVIVLSSGEIQRHEAAQAKFGVKSDYLVYLKLLEAAGL